MNDTQQAEAGAVARRSLAARFFGVVAERQSWLNLVYCLLAFPLGLFYFVFIVVGLSLGVGLVIIWVGVLILLVTIGAWWAFAALERNLARALLGVDLPAGPPLGGGAQGWLQKIKVHLSSSSTWKDFAFLLVKFPLGIASFVLAVVVIATPVWLITAPLTYRWTEWTDSATAVTHRGFFLGFWRVDSLPEAFLLVPVGILALFVGFHLVNLFTALWRVLVEALLDGALAATTPAPPLPRWPSGAGHTQTPTSPPPSVAPVPPTTPSPSATPAPPATPMPPAAPAAPPTPATPATTPAPASPAPAGGPTRPLIPSYEQETPASALDTQPGMDESEGNEPRP